MDGFPLLFARGRFLNHLAFKLKVWALILLLA
jgi:hypothetical protein